MSIRTEGIVGGEGGIRTPVTRNGKLAFESSTHCHYNQKHSKTSEDS